MIFPQVKLIFTDLKVVHRIYLDSNSIHKKTFLTHLGKLNMDFCLGDVLVRVSHTYVFVPYGWMNG